MGRTTTYTSIYSDSLWEEVDKDNKILLQDFIDYKKSTDKSNKTLYQYESVIKLFFIWNLKNNQNKFFVDIKKRDFIKFFNFMITDLRSSPNRIKTVRAILSSMGNYIENILDDEYPNYRNNIKKLETVAVEPVRDKTILSKEQIDTCLNKLVEDEKYQIACFMALAVASGARKAELLRFKCNYFDDSNIIFKCLYKTPEKISTKGRGSRGKMLEKFVFVKEFKPYFDLWMKERKKKHIDSEWLFVVERNGKCEQAEIHNADFWAKVISRYMNCNFYFHSLRHYYTTNARQSGLPDKVIQKLVGWESADLINLYDDSNIEDSFEEYFDSNGIKKNIKKKSLSDL